MLGQHFLLEHVTKHDNIHFFIQPQNCSWNSIKNRGHQIVKEIPRREYARFALNEIGHHLIGLLPRIKRPGNW